MKRTALKRRTCLKASGTRPLRQRRPLRRGPRLGHGVKKEPKCQSKEFRDAYKLINPDDEWERYLGFVPPFDGPADDPRRWLPPELNHIYTQPRRDLLPLVITLSKVSHDWFHAHIQEGRMLCLLVKCRKDEADLELWGKCFGSFDKPKSVIWWLECLQVAPRFLAYRDELLCRLVELSRRAA